MPLSFFRRKKSEDQAPLTRAPERPQVEPLTVETPAATGKAPTDNRAPLTEEASPRHARRTQPKEEHRPAAAARRLSPTGADASHRRSRRPDAREKTERKTRSRPSRAAAPRRKRAPLPKAKRELVVSVDAGEKRVAVLEDDQVAEVYLERPERRSIAGNIYLGVVDNVLPGMEAAFVEIGLEKNGFLYVDEIIGPELEGRKRRARSRI